MEFVGQSHLPEIHIKDDSNIDSDPDMNGFDIMSIASIDNLLTPPQIEERRYALQYESTIAAVIQSTLIINSPMTIANYFDNEV